MNLPLPCLLPSSAIVERPSCCHQYLGGSLFSAPSLWYLPRPCRNQCLSSSLSSLLSSPRMTVFSEHAQGSPEPPLLNPGSRGCSSRRLLTGCLWGAQTWLQRTTVPNPSRAAASRDLPTAGGPPLALLTHLQQIPSFWGEGRPVSSPTTPELGVPLPERFASCCESLPHPAIHIQGKG